MVVCFDRTTLVSPKPQNLTRELCLLIVYNKTEHFKFDCLVAAKLKFLNKIHNIYGFLNVNFTSLF